ncbi:MAG TPA: RND family transporter [Mycobacterium sp.]|nr:RND family transporter [Mycobacterium sp.]HTX97825.1 RND family transporter [Mycobacterium sp.]
MSTRHAAGPVLARAIRALSVPIILFWLALTAVTNAVVPQLEAVGRQNSVSLSPRDAPALMAMKRLGLDFQQFNSDSIAMIVFEGDQPLGDDAHHYYDSLVHQLEQDTRHVQHVQNFWGDPITAAGSQSTDGKAAYVQVNLAGNQGETLGNESVQAVRDIVARSQPPAGVRAYVAGQAPLIADMTEAGEKSMIKIMVVTLVVITVMLFTVYRSIMTTMLVLFVVLVEMSAARGLVALVGRFHLLGLSTFATSLLTSLAIAAGTNYAIFWIGRYQEARQSGQGREDAYYTAFRGVGRVILGSGLVVAAAMLCLRFTRPNLLSSIGIPSAIGLSVVVLGSLTLAPAALIVGSRLRLLDPRRSVKSRRWRKVGIAVARWPVPILAAAVAVALIGLLALPGYKTSYNDRQYIPADLPTNMGYTAAERHFSAARMNPDIVLLEAGRDLRNPADMIVLDKIAKNLFRVPGIARVQNITRPVGDPIAHSSIPFQVNLQSVSLTEDMQFLKESMAGLRAISNQLGTMIATMQRIQDLITQLTNVMHQMLANMNEMKATTNEMRDHLAYFDDLWKAIRNNFNWEPHCMDIPMCSSVQSVFDGVDKLSDNLNALLANLTDIDSLMPQLVQQLPPIIALSQSVRSTLDTMYRAFSGLVDRIGRMTDTASAMGQAFDDAKSDDYFYLPPEAFQSPDFQRGLKLMISPDGKAAQFIVTHDVDPASPEGISHVDPELQAAREAVKGTPLADAKIYLAGTAATYNDIQVSANWDLIIAGMGAITVIFVVMLIITRALIASFVIVGTVVLSLAAWLLSVLVWQYIVGKELHWMTLAFSVIILLAVGSGYNLLLISRFKEEIGAGIKTGIIRAMGATGGVATAAGLIFAVTMASMITSDLVAIGQGGTTIGLGLLFDTFVVRSLMIPSIAALLGRWFWWPLRVRSRPRRIATMPTPAPAAL